MPEFAEIKRYAGTYRDVRGEEDIVLLADGGDFQITIRGVHFSGDTLDSLDPVHDGDPDLLNSFFFYDGSLCDFVLEWNIPITVSAGAVEVPASLTARLDFGGVRPGGRSGVDRFELWLKLSYPGGVFSTTKDYDEFEYALADLSKQLPAGHFLKICSSCQLGLYPWDSSLLVGGLGCFRDNRDLLDSPEIRGRFSWPLFQKAGIPMVHETHVCPAFEQRPASPPPIPIVGVEERQRFQGFWRLPDGNFLLQETPQPFPESVSKPVRLPNRDHVYGSSRYLAVDHEGRVIQAYPVPQVVTTDGIHLWENWFCYSSCALLRIDLKVIDGEVTFDSIKPELWDLRHLTVNQLPFDVANVPDFT